MVINWKIPMNNPWSQIKTPKSSYTARVARPEHPYEFYWAKDVQGDFLFLLHSTENILVPSKIPKPNGIDIGVGHLGGTGQDQLVLTLHDKEDTDIFYSLCNDLMNATMKAADETSAIGIIIKRLERWQQFLKSNRSKIDEKALRGLLGELYFIKNHLLPVFTPEECLGFWCGPLGDVHDFGIGKTSVEVKTKASTQKATVTISSVEQLHCNLDQLFLFVLTVSKCSKQDENAVTVPELAEEIKNLLEKDDPLLGETFDALLMACGYMDLEEYKELFFATDKGSIFAVTDSFPKLSPEDIPEGVEKIRFDLNLVRCYPFLVGTEDLLNTLRSKNG